MARSRRARTRKRSRKRRGGQRVPSDCVRIKMPGMFGSLLKLDGEGQHASCPALPDGRTQNCMMIEPDGNPGDECASAAARRALKLNNNTPATIVGKCMPGYKCGRASWSVFGGRKRRKTKRKKRGGWHAHGQHILSKTMPRWWNWTAPRPEMKTRGSRQS